jgi:hypothetical protein
MIYKPSFSIGDIVTTPTTPQYPPLHYVITLEPSETLLATGKILLTKIVKGQAKEAWQVSYGDDYMIDTMQALHLSEAQLRRCTFSNTLSEEEIDELQTAHHFAEKQKKFGRF